jgi:hypothetical protein
VISPGNLNYRRDILRWLQNSQFEDLSKWQMKTNQLNRTRANIRTQVRADRAKRDTARADNTPRILPVAPNRKIHNASRLGASKNRAGRVDNARVRVLTGKTTKRGSGKARSC